MIKVARARKLELEIQSREKKLSVAYVTQLIAKRSRTSDDRSRDRTGRLAVVATAGLGARLTGMSLATDVASIVITVGITRRKCSYALTATRWATRRPIVHPWGGER